MDLQQLRKAIDDIDSQILSLIAKRNEYGREARQYKRAITDLSREEELRDKWIAEAASLGIDQTSALTILGFLIAGAKRQQERDQE